VFDNRWERTLYYKSRHGVELNIFIIYTLPNHNIQVQEYSEAYGKYKITKYSLLYIKTAQTVKIHLLGHRINPYYESLCCLWYKINGPMNFLKSLTLQIQHNYCIGYAYNLC